MRIETPSARTPSYTDALQRIYWLIQIRWFSAIGILIIVLYVAFLKQAVPSVIVNASVIFLIVVALNVFYHFFALKYFEKRPSLPLMYPWGLLFLQLAGDVFLMATAIHISGGMNSDFKFLMILTPLVAAVVIPLFGVALVAAFSLGAYFLVLYLEYSGTLRHYNPGDLFPVPPHLKSFESYKSLSHLIADFGILLGLTVVCCLVVFYLTLRLQRYQRNLRISKKELTLLKDRYRQLIEQAADAIFLVDAHTGIQLSNQSGEELLRMTTGTTQGVTLAEILHPQDRKLFLEQIRAVLHPQRQPHATVTFEGRAEKKDGRSPCILVFSIAPVSSEEGKTDILCIVRDITEQRQMESQHILSEKMSAMGILAGGMSHEFNNLLASIRGYAQLGSEQLTNEPFLKTALTVIEEQTTRGRQFIERLNRFAFPEKTERELVDLREVLEEVFALLRTQLRGDAIDVEKHYTSPTLLFGDKAQLHQVFLNLAVNARHAMRPKGKGVITVAIENTKKEVRVEFSDTGIGMRPEEAHHAFEPFFTTKGPLGGGPLPEEQISPTGLGLSLVHTILQSHGGSIDLDTTPGRGTTFTVLLPRVPHEREAGDPSAQSAHSTSLAGRHVLIAMEDAAFRQLLEELACSRGGDATGVERGSAVLNTLDRRGWDLLFLDCFLPGIHVEELLFEIRRSFPYLQYVLFSDPPLTEDKKRRFEVAGAAGILPKSFHLAEIDRLLSSLFSEPQETVSPET